MISKNQDDETNNKIEIEKQFEGTEKRLEIEVNCSNEVNLRKSISTDKWSKMLEFAKCLILSKTSNNVFDSYILSESSLFVFEKKIIMKTCGTTTLLLCLPFFLQLLKDLTMEIQFFFL